MVALYVTSFERYTGKDLITMGLMDRLTRDGFKVGFFKPFGHFPVTVDGKVTDKGAWLIYRLFDLDDPIESICPVTITADLIRRNYENDVTGLEEKINEAFEKISQQKDLVIVSCDNNFSEGGSFGLSGSQLIKSLNAHALFVERYALDFCIDFLLELKKLIGRPMLGVVFNKVDEQNLDEIKDPVSSFLHRKELDVYASLPMDALLGSVGVKDLVQYLDADVVCGKERLDTLVRNFLVGGMQVDQFISYMLESPSSAVIVGGDRTDIQLVAIESGVKCLILSGNLYPNQTITARAEAQGVPIVVVQNDTFTVAKKVESLVGTVGLVDRRKIDHGIKLVDGAFDFERLYDRLNLVPASCP